MLKTYSLSKNSFWYYDIELNTIARFPSKSNLLLNGSDNSVYFGMTSNKEVVQIFCELFNKQKIQDINGLSFEMECGDEKVNVLLNINAEGQIQVKVRKNGTMGRLTNSYAFAKMEEIDFTKMLIVFDFKKLEIRFKDPKELLL